MAFLTAAMAGIAFVLAPFVAIAAIFSLGVLIERLCRVGADAAHWLASHLHAV